MIPAYGPARILFFAACLLTLFAALVTGLMMWNAHSIERQRVQEWLVHMETNGDEAAERLDEDLRATSTTADDLAQWVEDTEPTVSDIEARLEEVVDEQPDIFGIGIGFTPYAYDEDTRLLSRYMIRLNDRHRMVALEDRYDYAAHIPEAQWYHDALEEEGWLEPFFAEVSEEVVVLYCAHIHLSEATQPDGMACVNYSIRDIWEIVTRLGLGRVGYTMVTTQAGEFIVHPQREFVLAELGIDEVAELRDDDEFHRFSQVVARGDTGFFRYYDPAVDQWAHIFHTPIAQTEWMLAVVAYDIEIPRDWLAHRHRHITITIATLITVLMVLMAFIGWQHFSRRSLWMASIVISLGFIIGIGRVWTLAGLEVEQDPPDAMLLLDPETTDRYVSDYTAGIEERYHVTPYIVPAGLVLESIEVIGPHHFQATGLIWCRYLIPDHDDLQRGITFPDAIDQEVVFEEVMRYREANTEIVGWSFQATLHNPTDISWFPLDVRKLPLRLWHSEFDRHVIIIPDLQAYSPIYPRALPGLQHDLVPLGWDVHRSFFAFRYHNYGADVGPVDRSTRGHFPELTYHIVVQRRLVDAFFSHQIPLVIALALMFAVAMLETRKREKATAFGFEAVKVLGVVTAIFFALIVAHIDARRRFIADELMYLEYFYFVTYFMIIAGAVNGYLVNSPDIDAPIVDYADNLIPKVLFWPITLLLLFLVTVIVFY